jgi:hypothetical protein
MKVFCENCGIHFKQDFKITLLPECNFWGDLGLGNIPEVDKLKLWDWMFKFPSDEFYIKYKLGMAMTIKAVKIEDDTKWENIKPGWEKLSEKERQDYERAFYKHKEMKKPTVADSRLLNSVLKKDKLLN